MRHAFVLAILVGLGFPLRASAQVIQLPSFSFFTVDTTVLVPDSGRSWVAGQKRGSSGTNQFNGLPRQRGIGVERGAAGVGVVAQIHDPEQADRALLGAAHNPRDPQNPVPPATRQATADMGVRSVAELARERAAESAAADREALALLAKAREAQSAGNPSLSNVYYGMASRQATGTLKQTIESERQKRKTATAGRPRAGTK